MPAMQSHDFLTPIRGKRLVKAKKFTDCVTKTSWTANPQTIVNVLELCSAILISIKTHSLQRQL